MSSESLTVTDNRTGKTYELPIEDGTVRGLDLRQIGGSGAYFDRGRSYGGWPLLIYRRWQGRSVRAGTSGYRLSSVLTAVRD